MKKGEPKTQRPRQIVTLKGKKEGDSSEALCQQREDDDMPKQLADIHQVPIKNPQRHPLLRTEPTPQDDGSEGGNRHVAYPANLYKHQQKDLPKR
jgi:hypothetical protein